MRKHFLTSIAVFFMMHSLSFAGNTPEMGQDLMQLQAKIATSKKNLLHMSPLIPSIEEREALLQILSEVTEMQDQMDFVTEEMSLWGNMVNDTDRQTIRQTLILRRMLVLNIFKEDIGALNGGMTDLKTAAAILEVQRIRDYLIEEKEKVQSWIP